MRTAIALLLVVGLSWIALGNPWIDWSIDFLPRESPSQTISLDLGFTVPFVYQGWSLDLYTGLLFAGDGPYAEIGKKLGFSFVYEAENLSFKLGMYNCGIDRDHFYFTGRYDF